MSNAIPLGKYGIKIQAQRNQDDDAWTAVTTCKVIPEFKLHHYGYRELLANIYSQIEAFLWPVKPKNMTINVKTKQIIFLAPPTNTYAYTHKILFANKTQRHVCSHPTTTCNTYPMTKYHHKHHHKILLYQILCQTRNCQSNHRYNPSS